MGLERIRAVEIDIEVCQHTFGVAPCTATGEKCFNTRNYSCDCKDPDNYSPTTQTIRCVEDVGMFPEGFAFANLESVTTSKAQVDPGRSIGVRATFSAEFKNHRTGDALLDPYIIDRAYNPFEKGTFWGKFKARNPFYEHNNFRALFGSPDQAYSEMRTEHFVLDDIQGPSSRGKVKMSGADFMRLLDEKTSLAPKPNTGVLDATLPQGSTSLTVTPAGVGDAQYSASGKIAIGEEVISFTRVADVLTLGAATSEEYSEGDSVQEILEYTSQTAAAIIYDLIYRFTPIDNTTMDLTAWQAITTDFSDPAVLYSTQIVKPTAVKKLVNELIEQAGLLLFADNVNQKIVFDILRPNTITGNAVDDSVMIENSFDQMDQPDKRYSIVIVYYNQRNVFKNLEEPGNFYGTYVYGTPENRYPNESIKRIFSRWIPKAGLTVATDVGQRFINRYTIPPRRFIFKLPADKMNYLSLGQTFPISHPVIEDCFGDVDTGVNAIVTGISSRKEGPHIEAEEFTYDTSALTGEKKLDIPPGSINESLREIYDESYTSVDLDDDIIFIIYPGVDIGSTNNSSYALRTGSWPAGTTLKLRGAAGATKGRIQGYGGRGADGYGNLDGEAGGPALLVEYAIEIDGQYIEIYGGAGGGGAVSFNIDYGDGYTGFERYGGGGGAGITPGLGGTGDGDGTAGTRDAGGIGNGLSPSNESGDGGAIAQPGQNGQFSAGGDIIGGAAGSGGAAGAAIDGFSLVTFTNPADVQGATNG